MWLSVGYGCACLAAATLLPGPARLWCALFAAGLFALACILLRRGPAARPGVRRRSLRIARLLLLGLCVGLVWCSFYDAQLLPPAEALAGEKQVLTAEVCTELQASDSTRWVDAELDPDGAQVRARLYLYGEIPLLRPGDRITGRFTVRRADTAADGSRSLFLQARGILLVGSGTVLTVEDGGKPFRYFPARLSHAVYRQLESLLPADAAGLPQAMLTGERSGLSESVQAVLTTAGASHIIAVSGLHVAMLFGLLLLVLGNRGWLTFGAGALLLLTYTIMTGASPSVERASLMLGMLLLAPLFQEENDPPTSLALAGLLILLWNPWAIANLSFQLSFGSVAGLLLVTQPLQEALLALSAVKKLLAWDGARRLPRWLRRALARAIRGGVHFLCGSLSATLGALVFTAPIAAAVFGSIPVYAVLTNVVVLPLASLCLAGALVVLALGLVSPALGALVGAALAWPVRAVFAICRLVSRLPGSTLTMDRYGLFFLIFVYGLLLLTLLLRETQVLRPLLALLAGLVIAVGFQRLDAASADFALAALDVGQGQCVCMYTPGFTVLVDCGGSGGSSVGTEAAAWLRQHGVRRLDALILTHYDTDHTNGVKTLLELVPTTAVYLPDVAFDPEVRAEIAQAAVLNGAALHVLDADCALPFSGGTVRLFAPVSEQNDNAACVSVLYSFGEYDMLVTGDLDQRGEYELLELERLPHVELYVAGHHGSARSSSSALLEAISPDTVFISVGRNSYGLPSAETLTRLEEVGAAIYRTDLCGTLEIGR